MIVRPKVLSFITTRRCTATCDHCCFGCSPTASDSIPVRRMHELIDEATRIESIKRIVFTGGECFLLGNDLADLVARATLRDFSTRAITNGYWGVTPRAATKRLRPLGDAGLKELMLSTGTFHQRFVPLSRVINAARASVSLGIPTRISVEMCDQSSFDGGALGDVLSEEVNSGLLCISRNPWIEDSGGRGTVTLSHQHLLSSRATSDYPRCEQVLNVLTVTPNQILMACCGFPMEQIEDLKIGSVADRALDDLLRNEPNGLFATWMHVAGPSGIARFVARYAPDYRLPILASVCEACTALQRDPVAMSIISEHANEVAADIAMAFARLQLSACDNRLSTSLPDLEGTQCLA